ncbi:MAG: hypothetical protein ACKOPU_00750 [Candidatus Planktophila sp.]
MEKQDVLNLLNNAADLLEGLEGNEDALEKAMTHIMSAINIIDKYAIEE